MTSFDCSGFGRVAGRSESISVGTVKLVEPGGAMQTKTALELVGKSSPKPSIATTWPLSPPDQEMVRGCVRSTTLVVPRFVQTNGVGMVKGVENAPTSVPPNPCRVYEPGSRNSEFGRILFVMEPPR